MYVFSYKLNLIILQPFEKLTYCIDFKPDNHKFMILYIYKLLKRLGTIMENLHLGIPKKIFAEFQTFLKTGFILNL